MGIGDFFKGISFMMSGKSISLRYFDMYFNDLFKDLKLINSDLNIPDAFIFSEFLICRTAIEYGFPFHLLLDFIEYEESKNTNPNITSSVRNEKFGNYNSDYVLAQDEFASTNFGVFIQARSNIFPSSSHGLSTYSGFTTMILGYINKYDIVFPKLKELVESQESLDGRKGNWQEFLEHLSD